MKRWISTLLAIVMVFAMGGVVFSEEPVNIAQGKAVTYMDGVMTDAGVVTDGNLDTSVVVFTDGSQIPFWWIKIDLGKEYAVSAVELATRIQWFGDDNEIGEIRFFGSNENIDVANMEEIAMSPHSGSMVVGAGESWHYDLPKERTCRYIAVGGAVGAGEVRVVSEVRVFGTDTEPLPQNWENVAAGKIVTCMDGLNLNGGSLTSLTDGTVATNVVLGGAVETPFWFKIDLGKPYSIAALELSTRHKWYGNDTEISLISFLGSNEDIAVDQMETITETPSDSEMDIGAGESWHYDLPEQKTYRYIAVSGVSPAGWNKIISEIRVFGSESSVTPPEPDPEPEENIAQGITPVVSGENLNTMGMLPETLTDGDLGTIWGVTNSDPASPAVYSVVVDLGKPYDIETVELVARDAGWGGEGEFSLISVKGSLENVPAAQMEEITTTPHHEAENKVTQGGTWSYPLPQAKTYRYIAVAGECPIGWAKVVAELRVFGSEATIVPPEPAENLALNKSMTWTEGLNFLGDIATYGPDKMVDGQDATFTAIQTDGQDTPFTLCIDLGGVYMVEEIELQARTPNYEIHELSNVSVHLGTSDPENLPVVATTPSYNAEDAIQEGGTWSYRLPKAKRGQYVAISGVIPAGYMFGCAEFRVFGTEAPVIEAEDRNVLLHKPYTSTEGIPFNGAKRHLR